MAGKHFCAQLIEPRQLLPPKKATTKASLNQKLIPLFPYLHVFVLAHLRFLRAVYLHCDVTKPSCGCAAYMYILLYIICLLFVPSVTKERHYCRRATTGMWSCSTLHMRGVLQMLLEKVVHHIRDRAFSGQASLFLGSMKPCSQCAAWSSFQSLGLFKTEEH